MKKTLTFILGGLIAASLLLGGCGKEESGTSVTDGVGSMQKTISELRTHLDANDSAKVKEDAEKLEEAWESFEDSVKEKSPDLYEKVETPLHTIEQGAKIDPLDVATLKTAADELDGYLTEVKNLK